MSSSVFFKFKSQKEPTRVEFDGTGISVFELKRDIITKSGLGDGTDFDLAIYTEDGAEEYDDDTTIIPRSTTVIARRLPPLKPGAGRAARYVSGKMPVTAKASYRKDQAAKPAVAKTSKAIAQMSEAMTEEEKMQAMFQAQTEQWTAQQEEMSHQTPVFVKSNNKRHANVPDHDPPNGYICYRCGEKGHWIQLCPTNDDPEFDNRPRVKRTTGIPRSFLTTVDKSVALAQGGDDEKRPSGIMINADGEFVVAKTDKASWEKFQAMAKSSTSKVEKEAKDKDIQEKGLECPIDKKMFIEPMKTPCCEKTFCNDCITNALIESDFVCPSCKTEGVLIDDLKHDDEMSEKIKRYLQEKADEAKSSQTPDAEPAAGARTEPNGEEKGEEAEDSKTQPAAKPAPPQAQPQTKSPPPEKPSRSSTDPAAGPDAPASSSSADATSKKRPAEDTLENPQKIPKGPKAMMGQEEQQQMANNMAAMAGMQGVPNMLNPYNPMNMMMGMNMPMAMPPMGMMPMGVNPMMGMPVGGMNMNGGFPVMNGNGMYGGYGDNMNAGMDGMNGAGMGDMAGGPANSQYNNQRNNFANYRQNKPRFKQQQPNDNDAYFRMPVNPHRHQKKNRIRPADFREL